ncbi:sugar-binding transcriptional regulator [Natranaerobius trueperi]|uniref:DeoR family transcriptional regulator n=1 Tax=Natranaerobius trueperi TaxID=759412 RepID=A0A226BXS6_9FIRM|nr:sugar-binding domain-containing protein [Natranaerobius trueperi]OWZ83796.1 DeoR family transcriptional regulator [Natranaerobius trueperi]
MIKEWDLLQKLTPELSELAEKRYKILASISFYQPIGRRSLSEVLQIKERELRNEIRVLKEKQLIRVESYGMMLTDSGSLVLHEGRELVKNISGLVDLERELKGLLKLERVIVVPGDSCEDETVKQEMGAVAAKTLSSLVNPGDIISVAGGSTLARMANMAPKKTKDQNNMIVPARGGLGERVEIQANTVAAELANNFNCSYRMLHVPDEVSKESLNTLLLEPKVNEILDLIKNANILIHGIGRAEEMAKRRGLSQERVSSLLDKGSVGEAFGFYLDKKGGVVERVNTVGLTLEDLNDINKVIAVSGGSDKSEAILAMLETGHDDFLITDEGAARKIYNLLTDK